MILDYILVGCGVAGTNLAIHLEEAGKKIIIIDDNQKTCSSIVAAGVLNPITGKRLVKSWQSENALPYAKEFYLNLEKTLKSKFFYENKILQVCKSKEEEELWNFRREDESYSFFLKGRLKANSLECIKDTFGSFYIEGVARIETEIFCAKSKEYFKENNLYKEDNFDYSQLKTEGDFVEYKGIKARAIIFCEGYKAIENPFFNWLPFAPAKGEILVFKTDAKLPKEIIHKEKWLMKIDEETFRCGSTWDRENFNQEVREEAVEELTKALKNILQNTTKLELCDKSAGVRPCTKTTRPFLGTHPKNSKLYIFNGFGSKGYALSPYFASEFTKYLETNYQFESQANISRHLKKFFRP